MMLPSLLLAFSVLAPAGQQTALSESFDSGIFPPSGWTEVNNGNSAGWEDSGAGAAFHDDFTGTNDNRLLTPPMDLGGFSQAYLHLRHTSYWTAYRGYNLIETTLDGGLTYGTMRNITDSGDFVDEPLNHDLVAYLGQPALQLSFRYIGDFGNEWSLEEVIVDDIDAADVPLWPNLPTAAVPANGMVEDFESWSGTVPAHMAINRVDEETRFFADHAWCNIGQLGPSQFSQGSFALEMGVDPNWAGEHYYSNALIFQLDGTDAGNLWLEFDALNHGEEPNYDDGVFYSLDGEDWKILVDDWDELTGGFSNIGTWQTIRTRITTPQVDTSGLFYLAFAEADNRPYGQYDGIAIDNIKVFSEPLLQVLGNGAGYKAWISVSRCQPGASVEVMYSKIGPGPTQSIYGLLSLSTPVLTIGVRNADATGTMLMHGSVPGFFAGTTVWLQAGMLWGDVGVASNPMAIHF